MDHRLAVKQTWLQNQGLCDSGRVYEHTPGTLGQEQSLCPRVGAGVLCSHTLLYTILTTCPAFPRPRPMPFVFLLNES